MELGLIEMVFFFAAALAWALYELWTVRDAGSKHNDVSGNKPDEDGPDSSSGP